MKILFTCNKTYRGFLDGGWWYFYKPLLSLGHDVYFYDTVAGDSKSYSDIIESYKPDLIFCIMTGDANIAPHEPWEQILKETNSGRTKTFNWFCDDTWRFDTFSKKACKYFQVCSTPERKTVDKYKLNGYDYIVVANWHANKELFPDTRYKDKSIDVSFIGAMNDTRRHFFKFVDADITFLSNITHEQLYDSFSASKIGINLSVNHNDPQKKTQMKQRPFEIAAGRGLIFTEYHEGIEEYFEIDREIITFSSVSEFNGKMKFLLKRPKLVEKISSLGYDRFIKEHESKVRIKNLLNQIGNK